MCMYEGRSSLSQAMVYLLCVHASKCVHVKEGGSMELSIDVHWEWELGTGTKGDVA